MSTGLLAAAFMATIVAANVALALFGLVPVGFGLVAPAGVYFAGLGFTLRDLLHDQGDRRVVLLAILAGAVLSSVVSSRFALASGAAFLVSELADYAVYGPLRRRGWLRAVVASNLVGLVVDSAVFLVLAFGSLAYLPGQVVGKTWVTALVVVVIAAKRRLA